MYKRIIYEHWHVIVPALSFATTLAFFGLMSIRALFLRKEKAEKMSRLPLE
jgi:hypothetical protein